MQLRLSHPLLPMGLLGAPETDIWLAKAPWHLSDAKVAGWTRTAWPDCRDAFLVWYLLFPIKEVQYRLVYTSLFSAFLV